MPAVFRPLAVLTLAGSVALLPASCGILDDDGASHADGSTVNTGLSKIGGPASAAPTLRTVDAKPVAPTEPDINLSDVFDRAASQREKPAVKAQPTPQPQSAVPNTALAHAAPAKETPAPTPDQRIAAASLELRQALQDRPSHHPFADSVTLTMLDLVATPSGPADHGADLAPAQRRVLATVRTILNGLVTGGASDGDPTKAADLLDEARADLSPSQAVRISKVALCKRVLGYGQYEPFPTATFVAGRANRVVVYVEVENFSHRPSREGDPGRAAQAGLAEDAPLWTVELSQELWMTHDADGTTQWRRPEQTITEVSRNRRRDFYLVQQIDLPPTLSVGRFNLKVTLRDKVTGSTDERVLPVTIVADAETALHAPPQTKPLSKPQIQPKK